MTVKKKPTPEDTLKREILEQVRLGLMTTEEAAETIEIINSGGYLFANPGDGPRRVYFYIRVSDQKQVQSGLSLEAQEATCRAYYEYLVTKPQYQGLEFGGFFIEKGISAFSRRLIERPKGSELNRKLRPGDQVVFVKLDRGFRNVRDFLNTSPMWERRGIGIHFLDLHVDMNTANGRFFATVVAAVAQWESDVKSERVRAANERKRLRREALNQHAPVGTQLVGRGKVKRIAPDRKQEAILQYVTLLRDRQGLSWEKITERLEEILAAKEGRKPIPLYNNPPWGRIRIQRGYQRWKSYREELRQRSTNAAYSSAVSMPGAADATDSTRINAP